jgi:hypothetical protein
VDPLLRHHHHRLLWLPVLFFVVWVLVAWWCWQTKGVTGFLHLPSLTTSQSNGVALVVVGPSRRKLSIFWLEKKSPSPTRTRTMITPSSSSRKFSSVVLLSESPDQETNTPNHDEDDDGSVCLLLTMSPMTKIPRIPKRQQQQPEI